MIHVFLTLLLFTAHLAQGDQTVQANAAPTTPNAGPFQKDPRVVACLDKNHKPNDQIPHVGYHQVTDPNVGVASCAQGDMKNFKQALTNQLNSCKSKSEEDKQKTFRFDCRDVKMETYCIDTNQQLLDLAEKSGTNLLGFMQKAREKFDVYQSDGYAQNTNGNPAGTTKFTGYNSPKGTELTAFANKNRIPADQDPVAILGPPDSPNKLVEIPENDPANCGYARNSHDPIKWCLKNGNSYKPLPTSEQIMNGALDGKSKVLGYMPRKQYEYLKLEGAGEVVLEQADGTVVHVKANYAGKNGQQGNLLGSIVSCLKQFNGPGNPPINDQRAYISWLGVSLNDALKYNESYTFFDVGGKDFYGVDKIPLIKDHVMATDPSSIPTGSVNLVQTSASNKNCSLIMTASDKGSAIKGARSDLYAGEGPEAKKRSNQVDGPGSVFTLLPKNLGKSCR